MRVIFPLVCIAIAITLIAINSASAQCVSGWSSGVPNEKRTTPPLFNNLDEIHIYVDARYAGVLDDHDIPPALQPDFLKSASRTIANNLDACVENPETKIRLIDNADSSEDPDVLTIYVRSRVYLSVAGVKTSTAVISVSLYRPLPLESLEKSRGGGFSELITNAAYPIPLHLSNEDMKAVVHRALETITIH